MDDRDITRPYSVGRNSVIAALALTALLAAALSLGVGRGRSESELREMIRKNAVNRERNIEPFRIAGLDDHDIVAIRSGGDQAAYVKSDGSLWIAPFDDDSHRVTGPPKQIGSNVAIGGPDEAEFSISRKGTVSYIEEGPRTLAIVTRSGRLHPAVISRENYSSPRFSPDGRKISVDFTDSTGRDVWIVTLETAQMRRATHERDAHNAAWAPDGRSLTFTSYRLGALGIYRANPETHAIDSVFTSSSLMDSGEWLEDGSGIVTTALNLSARSGLDLAFIRDSARGPVMAKLADQYRTRMPAVSPDGKLVAFVSNKMGRDHIFLSRWDSVDTWGRVSTSGGVEPVWSRDGKTLFYRETSTGYLVALSVRTIPTLAITAKTPLFPMTDIVPGVTHANYDVSPDDSTFVVVRRSSTGEVKVVPHR
jgi:dipeptidyl aminopeptidase/acylaminoacyl peptidase